MRVVVQRVNSGSCSVDNKVVGKINNGYLVLLGIGKGDTEETADKLVKKVLDLRINSDKDDKMNLSIKDINGEILLVSQFTLYGDTSKGNRPSFIRAAQPTLANKLYEYFIAKLRESKIKVETGQFGAMMKIDVELDGPTTIILNE